jgi:uncharacterized membrane protein
MSDEQSELQRLRQEVRELQERAAKIGYRLDQMEGKVPVEPPRTDRVSTIPPPVIPPAPPVQAPPPVIPRPLPIPAAPKESFEVRLGTYWLPRIGIAVLLTGMVFFAAYVTPRLSVSHKVAMGYLACIVLGGLGLWLEKKLPAFARILQAGSLALAYFVTYAAHFVEAFRVIQSPTVAIALLSVVVVFIVTAAQNRQSPTLGGMALFFGYYTSIMSGVATFTLASNAVLALAAIFFLARNRWVTISFGAVLATYLTYMIWVWKLSRWGDVDHLIFDSGYLDAESFRLRAAFLSLYWLLFAVGGLIIHRNALAVPERNGLLTLNNALFFVLFSLLMHHAYPGSQWQFQFLFAGVLLIASAIGYQRYQPERSVMDTLFVQGLAVATLGLMSYFKGVRLVAALALESAFLLVLARWMNSRWVAWIGRVVFAAAAIYAWNRYPDWDSRMIYGVVFAAIVGFVCARLERQPDRVSFSAAYFAFISTMLAMAATHEQFEPHQMPWVWTCSAVVVATIAALLRSREIGWAAHVPLATALGSFYLAQLDGRAWALAPSLALIATTLAFGMFGWGRARAQGDDAQATNALRPYAFLAMIVTLVVTVDHSPERWRLTVFAAETLVLVIAAMLAGERTFAWLAVAAMIVGALGYLTAKRSVFADAPAAWGNFFIAALLLIVSERLCKRSTLLPKLSAWVVVIITAVAVVALRRLVTGAFLTVSWAALGFVLLAFGFAIKERSYRLAGLVALAFGLLRAVFHDMAKVETIYRILSFIGLGVILLVLAFIYAKNREKLAKWL